MDVDDFLNGRDVVFLDPRPVDMNVGSVVALLDGEARLVRILSGVVRRIVRSGDFRGVHFEGTGLSDQLGEWKGMEGSSDQLEEWKGMEEAEVVVNTNDVTLANADGDGCCHCASGGVARVKAVKEGEVTR